jgi:hypothetical protein
VPRTPVDRFCVPGLIRCRTKRQWLSLAQVRRLTYELDPHEATAVTLAVRDEALRRGDEATTQAMQDLIDSADVGAEAD